MTELERQLLASVERLDRESREREEKLISYLKEVEAQLKELGAHYSEVVRYLKNLR